MMAQARENGKADKAKQVTMTKVQGPAENDKDQQATENDKQAHGRRESETILLNVFDNCENVSNLVVRTTANLRQVIKAHMRNHGYCGRHGKVGLKCLRDGKRIVWSELSASNTV